MTSERLRIVVDPTVLVGALLEPRGDCGTLLRQIAEGRVDVVLDDTVRRRLTKTLEDPEAQATGGWDGADVARWMDALDALSLREDELVPGLDQPAPAEAVPVTSIDRAFFELAQRTGSHLVSIDPDTLAQSGGLGVDVLRPGTISLALGA